MNLHQAILELYPNVVTIRGTMAYDKDGNTVRLDMSACEELIAAREYQSNRAAEYPSIAEQLDTLYHGGFDEWKASIKAVKDKYPKP